jgi:hypothetical protein
MKQETLEAIMEREALWELEISIKNNWSRTEFDSIDNAILDKLRESHSEEAMAEARMYHLVCITKSTVALKAGEQTSFIVLQDNETEAIASYGTIVDTANSSTMTAYETPKQVKEVITYKEI